MFFEILSLLGAYLIGSIPSGYIVARLKGIGDIRSYGSGNIGATNVGRTLGVRYFFVVFFIDFLKAAFCLTVLSHLGSSQELLFGAAGFLLLGNAFSVFLRFRGGKGFATTLGIIYVLHSHLFVILLILWASVFLLKRPAGIASVTALVFLPICTAFVVCETAIFVGLTIVISGLGLFLHRNNIRSYFVQS